MPIFVERVPQRLVFSYTPIILLFSHGDHHLRYLDKNCYIFGGIAKLLPVPGLANDSSETKN